ncbi:MAG: hypothetical protein WCR08_08405 [Gammaproteobacteria bacterium]
MIESKTHTLLTANQMEQQSYIIKLLKKLFWWANLPCLLLVSLYCVATHQNPVDSFLFIFTISLCIPYAFVKVEEYKDETIDRMHDEFFELSDKELIDTFKKAHTLPPGKQKGMYIGMLESELERRFGSTEN